MFPREWNILERNPMQGSHFNWLHVLEEPHRGRGPREPTLLPDSGPGGCWDRGPAIWPAAPDLSLCRRDRCCGHVASAVGSDARRWPC